MNKLVEEFAVQAKKFAIEQMGHPHDPTLFSARVFQEKFAELIVNECITACSNHKDVESFGIYPIRVAMVTEACRNNIKEHFGL